MTMSYYVLDACAIIAFINDEEGAMCQHSCRLKYLGVNYFDIKRGWAVGNTFHALQVIHDRGGRRREAYGYCPYVRRGLRREAEKESLA